MNLVRKTRRFITDLKHQDYTRMSRREQRVLKRIRREFASAKQR